MSIPAKATLQSSGMQERPDLRSCNASWAHFPVRRPVPCQRQALRLHWDTPPRRHHLRHSAAIVSAAVGTAQPRADYRLDPPVTREQLQDPAHIGARTTASVDVQDRGGATALTSYMQLPVDAYYELDPGMIKPLGGGYFALLVPRIQLFNVWVEPLVHVAVQLIDDRSAVLIKAVNWSVRGSQLIESLELNRRFSLAFSARLTWTPAPAVAGGGKNGSQNGSAAALQWSGANSTQAAAGTGKVHANMMLDVWSEVIGPFRLLPRSVLEGTGNAVLNTLISTLLPTFLKQLADDYGNWALSPEYRARRMQMAPTGFDGSGQ